MNRFKWAVVVVAACMLAAVVYVGGRASAQAPGATASRNEAAAQDRLLVTAVQSPRFQIVEVKSTWPTLNDSPGTFLLDTQTGMVWMWSFSKEGRGWLLVHVQDIVEKIPFSRPTD